MRIVKAILTVPGGGRALLALEQDRHPHSPRDAQGGEPGPYVRPAHLVEESRRNPGPGRADGMTEGDRAALDVHARQVERQVARACENLGGERLVQLDAVDLLESAAGPGEKRLDRRDRTDA